MRRCRKTGAAGRGQRQGRRQAQRESKRVACAGTAQAGDGASGTVNGSVVVASLVVAPPSPPADHPPHHARRSRLRWQLFPAGHRWPSLADFASFTSSGFTSPGEELYTCTGGGSGVRGGGWTSFSI